MPIYEFHCPDCNTLFSFLSRRPGVERRPNCPRCGRKQLERRASAFAVSSGKDAGAGAGAGAEEEGAGLDPARLTQALEQMARGVESVAHDDPRRMAGAMRKLLDRTGLRFGESMDQALSRLEAGEDPERIDEELGASTEEGDQGPWLEPSGSSSRRGRPAPRIDDQLYEL
jgi:putative FmdB family regulatory protein